MAFQYSPTFKIILEQIHELRESDYGTEKSQKLFRMARFHAPAGFNVTFENKMRQLGLLPEPERWDDQGNGLVTLAELAAHHGKSYVDAASVVAEINGHYRKALLELPPPEGTDATTGGISVHT